MRPFKFFKDNDRQPSYEPNEIYVLVKDIDGEDFGIPAALYTDIQDTGRWKYNNYYTANRLSGEHGSYSFNIDNLYISLELDLIIVVDIMVEHVPIPRRVEVKINHHDI
jgi:hypothetical protein